MAARSGAIFVPYVVETFGGVGKEASVFNKIVANFAEQRYSTHTREEILVSLSSDIARIVQVGNHRIFELAFQQLSSASPNLLEHIPKVIL